jgi:hypothetical protein
MLVGLAWPSQRGGRQRDHELHVRALAGLRTDDRLTTHVSFTSTTVRAGGAALATAQ